MELNKPMLTVRAECASRGQHVGTARLIRRDEDLDAVEPGDVLVSSAARIAVSQVLGIAGAIVSEEGGVLSNLAIVSRELGIPCVVGAARAMDAIRDGDRLLVDADAGLVSILASRELVLGAGGRMS
jgi:pyruvate,water dikinase